MNKKYKSFKEYANDYLKTSYVGELKEIISFLPEVKDHIRDLSIFVLRLFIFIFYPIRLVLVYLVGWINYKTIDKRRLKSLTQMDRKIKSRHMSMKELKVVDPELYELENSYKTFVKEDSE